MRKITSVLWNKLIKAGILALYHEKRALQRIRVRGGRIYIGTNAGNSDAFTGEASLVDINEEAVQIRSNRVLDNQSELILMLQIDCAGRNRNKRKTAFCKGSVYMKTEMDKNGFRYKYVIKYLPLTPLNHYLLHKYFLQESIQ